MNAAKLKTWLCPLCTSNLKKPGNNASTPVRAAGPVGDVTGTQNSSVTTTPVGNESGCVAVPRSDQFDASVKDNRSGEVDTPLGADNAAEAPQEKEQSISYEKFESLINKKFDQFRDFLKQEIKSEIAKVTSSLSTKITTLNGRMQLLEAENAGLKESISQLKADSNHRNRVALLNDVELTGVPECEGESVGHIVTVVAQKLGVVLDVRDVVSAVRVGALRDGADVGSPGAGSAAHGRRNKPRPIVVRLARRSVRDQLMKSARVRRGATSEGLGLPQHVPLKIHVNERLTKENRVLFAKARSAAGKSWKYFWTMEGRVYARQYDGAKRVLLTSEADLERVFGRESLAGDG